MVFYCINCTSFWCLLLMLISYSNGADYVIKTSWDNATLDSAEQIKINLENYDGKSFKIVIEAPFYDDPPPDTPGDPGESKWRLWDFELVKIFFMNNLHQYIEIELGAWGHHFVLLLNGYRHTVQFGMLINYNADRIGKRWNGTAIIPLSYLPTNTSKMNMYSFHGLSDKRVVNALYPVSNNPPTGLDDHRIEAYQPFDVTVLPAEQTGSTSSVWSDAIQGIRSFKIASSWNGKALSPSESVDLHIQLDASSRNLVLNVSAPFYDDRAPEEANGGPFADLYNYEVVHLYLLSYPDFKYVEIELGPWGHYLVVFWNGYYNKVGNLVSLLKYTVNRNASRWTGSALIPLIYLPPKVYLMNAHSSHGVDAKRQWNSLYPVPSNSNQTSPDYHALKYYKFIDITELYPENDDPKCSQIWQDLNVCQTSAVQSPTSAVGIVLFNVAFVLLFNM
ncbi:uncharacterized protein LOC116931257 [Daphnia magna]|uniref:uncharacterized protein LOC116931257 n=1 Tax=Daphnia magna TaxID=35525 RepID=UPI001E1BC977|nr:uncharacterized protein LOC116931257 [Daphnia magna]